MKPPSTSGFSAVIITRNEADNIGPCLKPLQHVTDDIVVVDAFSDDNTVAICQSMGARVVQKEWQGYSANKNFGNDLCKYDWVLSIDADEILSEELIDSLRKIEPQPGTVYALDRMSNYCGQLIYHSGWYPDWKVRLFDRRVIKWQGDFVHEQLAIPPGFHTEKLRGKLWHYSYKTHDDHLQRIERYSDLAARELFEKGKRPGWLKRAGSPAWRFFKTYFIKQGFRDGKNGWIISKRNAYLIRRRHEKLEALYRENATKK